MRINQQRQLGVQHSTALTDAQFGLRWDKTRVKHWVIWYMFIKYRRTYLREQQRGGNLETKLTLRPKLEPTEELCKFGAIHTVRNIQLGDVALNTVRERQGEVLQGCFQLFIEDHDNFTPPFQTLIYESLSFVFQLTPVFITHRGTGIRPAFLYLVSGCL